MNVPNATHIEGVWEHQIATVQSVMLATLDKNGAQLDDESLGSFLCEEPIVNSRPLSINTLSDPDFPDIQKLLAACTCVQSIQQ